MARAMPASRPRRRAGAVQRTVFLDKAARDWALLLDDPCNAGLVHGCFPSGNGGTVLVRFENDQIVANGATEVASFGAWVPGYGIALQNATPLTSDVLGSLVTPSTLANPGDTFLKTNSNGIRCVAACLQLSYPGSELTRAGVVSIGLGPADAIATNIPTAQGGANLNSSAQTIRILSQHVQRMPQDVMECKWFPGDEDLVAYDSTYPTLFGQNLGGRNAIYWSASGFPVSTGVRIRMVAVYEISLTTSAASPAVQAIAPPVSNYLPNQILKAMHDIDPQWYLTAAKTAGTVLGSAISYASQGVKAAGLAVNGMALLMG